MIEEFRVPLGQLHADNGHEIRARSAFEIQRGHLMLMMSGISVLLGLGGAGISLYVYKATQQELQREQTFLARVEGERARAEARLRTIESGLKGIDLSWAQQTFGDPRFQQAVVRLFNQIATPLVECVMAKEGETQEAFQTRCAGKDLASVLSSVLGITRIYPDPSGGQPPPSLKYSQDEERTITPAGSASEKDTHRTGKNGNDYWFEPPVVRGTRSSSDGKAR